MSRSARVLFPHRCMAVCRPALLLLLSLAALLPGFAADAPQTTPATASEGLRWGVNMRVPEDAKARTELLATRNLTLARINLFSGDGRYLARCREQALSFQARGMAIQAIAITDFSTARPRNQDITANLSEVEQTAYDQTVLQVKPVADLIHDIEMQNEMSWATPNILKPGATGQAAADFDTPVGRLHAAVFRGMSRAIADVGVTTKQPLRRILGVVGRHWGFVKMLQAQGVAFDVLGYHIYPAETHQPFGTDSWFGTGGMFTQLAQFAKPVTINEYNSGEIYFGDAAHADKPTYENLVDKPSTEQGFRSFDKHLKEIVAQHTANIESVLFYQLSDDPRKAAPENHFGLFYDEELQRPKVSWLLAASFAGGVLSPDEWAQLSVRKIGGSLGKLQVPATAPVVGRQPAGCTARAGRSAVFRVVATGGQPLTFQWSRNGALISGATRAAYTTPALAEADDGAVFRVEVRNKVGSVVSDEAVLHVTASGEPVAPAADVTQLWDARLRAAACAALKRGSYLVYDSALLGPQCRILAIDAEDGAMEIRHAGAQASYQWRLLTLEEKKTLAGGMAAGSDPERLALAAYFSLLGGSVAAADPYLRQLPPAAADELKVLFRLVPAPAATVQR